MRDKHGNVWPPKHTPRLTTPGDPLCILRDKRGHAAAASLEMAQESSRKNGWRSGTITGLNHLSDGTVKSRILDILQLYGPMTRQDLNERMSDVKPKRIGTRLFELQKQGRATLSNGTVWRAIAP